MKRTYLIWIVIVVVAVVVAAWWVIAAPGFNQATNQETGNVPAAPVAPPTVINTPPSAPESAPMLSATPLVLATSSNPKLGTYLVAANGMTLYKFTKDTPNSGASACTGPCAAIWPAYIVSSPIPASFTLPGASGMVGTITLPDGTAQLTYNGWPLYFYAKDKNPGDANGQNVAGIWFVVAP